MAIVRATEEVDWYREFDVTSGKDRFFYKGSDCLAREEGYCRLHELNKHLMQLHKVKASKSGGEGQTSSPAGLKTRSSMRHSGGRPDGFRYERAMEASLAPMQQQKLNGSRRDRNYATWVELKLSLQQSLRTISKIITKSKGKSRRRNKSEPTFKSGEVGSDGDLQWTPRPIVPMGSPQRHGRQRRGLMPCPNGGAHTSSGPLFPAACMPSPLDTVSPSSPEMMRRPKKGKGRPPLPVPLLEKSPFKKLKKSVGPGLLTWPGAGLPATPSTDESNYDAYSPPSDAFMKTPPTISKADPSMMHLSGFHSVKEVIESINDTTPVRQYDVDRESPVREPRGSSNRRPILLDSPVQSGPVDDIHIPLLNSKSALNVKWDGGGKQSFMVPIYGKMGKGKENIVQANNCNPAAFSPPTVTGLVNEAGDSPVGSGILHGTSPMCVSPQSLGLSELLAKVDNLSPISLPCLVRNHPVHGKAESKTPNLMVPLPSPSKTVSEVHEASTQSMSSMEYDVKHAIADKDRECLLDDASDSF